MSNEKNYDLVIKNLQVVRPNTNGVESADIGIQNGAFKRIAPSIDITEAAEVMMAKISLPFPV